MMATKRATTSRRAKAREPKKVPVKAGRKTKRTPETEAKILEALEQGNTRRAACAYAGISEDTLANWQKAFSDFSDSLTRAEDNAERGYTKIIQEAARNGDWKAAAWWLERRRKADYSSRQEVTGADGKDIAPQAVMFVPYEAVSRDSDDS